MLPSILIPAYKPDEKMIALIRELMDAGFSRILVIDDGSGSEYAHVFAEAEQLGCRILTHAINMGKGRALKTGINEAIISGDASYGIITADADGQHITSDIVRIAEAMQQNPEAMVLGVRRFVGQVPLRNRIGNGITRFIFALVNGHGVLDTQTGLRGFSRAILPLMLSLKGERYEYEMNMLLEARPQNIRIVQVPIDTVYIDGNQHSHYNVFIDSVRIYALIIKYMLSSFVAGIVDYGIFALMHINFPNQLIGSVVTARVASSMVNFIINKHIVFRKKGAVANAALRYYMLVIFIMMSSYGLIYLLSGPFGMNVFLSKIITDIFLSLISFVVQREFVYKPDSKYKVIGTSTSKTQ